ncbi:MAG: response regulator transcription factor [Negativicutes bacterium]|nr:response regulator transcription factor [Negativicutes bacterium]
MAAILVVDDDREIVGLVRERLTVAGHAVTTAHDYHSAVDLITQAPPDVAVIDWMLGDHRYSGVDICRLIRSHDYHTFVIMLTARVDENDRVAGLEAGADDYLTKPFSPRELTARIQAMLRRRERARLTDGRCWQAGNFTIDSDSLTATLAGTPVPLTVTEFKIVALLTRHSGRIYSRSQIIGQAMPVNFDGYDAAIESHIKNIRHKLGKIDSSHEYIKTIYRAGYKWQEKN